jgi:hypothetical protein
MLTFPNELQYRVANAVYRAEEGRLTYRFPAAASAQYMLSRGDVFMLRVEISQRKLFERFAMTNHDSAVT